MLRNIKKSHNHIAMCWRFAFFQCKLRIDDEQWVVGAFRRRTGCWSGIEAKFVYMIWQTGRTLVLAFRCWLVLENFHERTPKFRRIWPVQTDLSIVQTAQPWMIKMWEAYLDEKGYGQSGLCAAPALASEIWPHVNRYITFEGCLKHLRTAMWTGLTVFGGNECNKQQVEHR